MNAARLPPLQTLRAFEAAVRLSSFTRAAEELALTQGAVSQHVRALEHRLGTTLFMRERARVVPTPEAHVLALQVRQGLEVLDRAFANRGGRGRAPRARVPLTLSVLPAFAARWLEPRLADFVRRYPHIGIELRRETALARLDGRDGIDVALRYGPGTWPGLHAHRWMDEEIFPVASPLIGGGKLPRRFADLARFPLLRHVAQPWEPWFQAAGLGLTEPRQGPLFTDAGALIDAAVAGQGVALARASLVEAELESGRLVRLWRRSIGDIYAHYVVWRPDSPKRTAIEVLLEWLRAQTAKRAG